MKIKKFYDLIKKGNTDEIIEILSYKYFNEYTNIKNIYNRAFQTTLFYDIKNNYKKEFKLFLLGIFHEKIDIECYLIHKDRYNDKIDILSNYIIELH